MSAGSEINWFKLLKADAVNSTTPRYLLFSEARRRDNWLDNNNDSPLDRCEDQRTGGQWRFVLESLDGPTVVDVTDDEETNETDRLELLAVVRGLEALEQPSKVTLVTSSRYVSRGLRRGLEEWRASDWQWERVGQNVPMKNGDLWRRVDRALQFHQVDCRTWRFDSPESGSTADTPFAAALGKTRNAGCESDFQPVTVGAVKSWVTRWKTKLCSYWTQSIRVFRPPQHSRPQAA